MFNSFFAQNHLLLIQIINFLRFSWLIHKVGPNIKNLQREKMCLSKNSLDYYIYTAVACITSDFEI